MNTPLHSPLKKLNTLLPFTEHIFIYPSGHIRIFSLWSRKARLFLRGRKGVFQSLEEAKINDIKDVVWVHCASLGEFEQARPLIDRLKRDNKILLTFFSPSGYEIRKKYEGADWVYYMPLDSRKKAERFVELVMPKAAYFTKYEIWYHYLQSLKSNKISTYLFSAKFLNCFPVDK